MYKGFYVNLASNTVRNESLVNRLRAIGAETRYQRVEAVDGRAIAAQYESKLSPGDLGIWMSHVNLLRAQQGSPLHLHIMEDDTTLADNAMALFEQVLAFADGRIGEWDILLTDVAVSLDSQLFSMLSEKVAQFRKSGMMTVVPLNRIQFAGMASIFIRQKSLGKYMALMEEGWKEGMAIDLYLQKMVLLGKLNGFVTVPFLTSPTVHGEQSDIRGTLTPSRLVMDLYRRAFFKDADLNGINEQLRRMLVGAKVDMLSTVFLNATAFVFSDKWQAY